MSKAVKILIIEDDIDLAESIQEALSAHGFETSHEIEGDVGLDAVEHDDFDIVLTDFRLPGMGGLPPTV